MLFRSVLLLAGLSLAAAQLTPAQIAENIPACASQCVKDAAPVVGCVETNYRCQCERSAAMNEEAYDCLLENCDEEDLQTAKIVTLSICEALRMEDLASRTAPVSPTSPPPGANRSEEDEPEQTATTDNGTEAEATESLNAAAPAVTGFGFIGAAALVAAVL